MSLEKAIKNITSERVVIGILLNHPEWLLELDNRLRPEYFFMPAHKTLYFLISTLLAEGAESIDGMAVLARAERYAKATDVLEDSGGIEYIEELRFLAEHYTKADLQRYANEVITTSFKREQVAFAEGFIKTVTEKADLDIAEINALLHEEQQALVNKYLIGSEVKFLKDIFDEVWQEIEDSRSGDGIVGLPSKIAKVNDYFGYQNGELIVYGARAKFGKSIFALNEAAFLAIEHGIPVAIFDTEMRTRSFLARLVAHISEVPIREIQTGAYLSNPQKVKRVEAAKEVVRRAPIIHKYDTNWTPAKVNHTAKLLKIRHNIGLLIYDYIKVMEVNGGVKEHQLLGNWTITLKNLAGELDIPIITFAQLSPYEMRLADSDKINRYASVVAYLLPKDPKTISRDFGPDKGGTDYMFIDYNRLGKAHDNNKPDEGINLLFKRDIARVEQAPYQVLDDDYQ